VTMITEKLTELTSFHCHTSSFIKPKSGCVTSRVNIGLNPQKIPSKGFIVLSKPQPLQMTPDALHSILKVKSVNE